MYNALALPTLLHGCETWEIEEQNKSRMSAEIKFMRGTAHGKLTKPGKIFYQIKKKLTLL
jgi:hypothetical protein